MEYWQRQFIRYLFPYSASRIRIEPAFLVKNPHVPLFLYKYREFKVSHLDALKRGILYMSSPDRFNDPFDTTIFFDPSRFIVEDFSADEFLEKVEEIERDLRAGNPWHPKAISKPIRQGEWIRRVVTDLLGSESADAVTAVVNSFLDKQSQEARGRMSEAFRKGFSVLSLSANPTSTPMWSHYANSHQGFCIEYDFGSLLPDDPRRRMCFPVLYRRKTTDATRYMANIGGGDFNNLFGEYLCLLKSAAWAHEEEWRIVYAIGPPHANREIAMPKPSAIILGSSAKSDDMKTMEEFCGLKSIALKRAIQIDSTREIIIPENQAT